MDFKKRLLIFLLVFSFSIPPFELIAEPGSGRVFFEKGLRLRQAGKLLEAEVQFKQALSEEPANADYHFELSNVYAARYDKWSKHPQHPRTQELLDMTAAELEQALMFRPMDIAFHYNLGVVYKRRGEFEKARHHFRKVIDQEPGAPHAWMQIGATYEEQGFYDDAKDAYSQALEKDYTNPEIRGAIDDLKSLKANDEERMLARRFAEQRLSYLQGFRFSPNSSAQSIQRDRINGFQSGRSVQSAIPFVAAMLVDQFIKRRGAGPYPEEE